LNCFADVLGPSGIVSGNQPDEIASRSAARPLFQNGGSSLILISKCK
jgi:hypothetical protein